MEKIKWHTEKRKLADLKDWERNPRQATAKQKEDLEKWQEQDKLDYYKIQNIRKI